MAERTPDPVVPVLGKRAAAVVLALAAGSCGPGPASPPRARQKGLLPEATAEAAALPDGKRWRSTGGFGATCGGCDDGSPDGQQPDGRKLSGGAIASLTGVGVLLVFIFQNTNRVRFQFLFWTFTWPLWWYTIMTVLFGALVWFGLGVMRRHRRRVERRAAR
jgi:uncharacterized integral membrane protein